MRSAPRRFGPTLTWLVVVMLQICLTPGGMEISENLAHLIVAGDFAHGHDEDVDTSQHGGSSSEHGCTGTMHLCDCCPSPTVILAAAYAFEPFARDARRGSEAAPSQLPRGVPAAVERPPWA